MGSLGAIRRPPPTLLPNPIAQPLSRPHRQASINAAPLNSFLRNRLNRRFTNAGRLRRLGSPFAGLGPTGRNEVERAWASIRRSTNQTIEHGWVDGPLEFQTADMSNDPSDGCFNGMKVVELHPNALADFRALHELRLAALGREIEYANSKAAPASPPNSDIRRELRAGRRPRQFRSFGLRHHDCGRGIG